MEGFIGFKLLILLFPGGLNNVAYILMYSKTPCYRALPIS